MKNKIVITDACIFIDLFELDLVASFFDLELEIHTTTSVYFELYDEQRQVLVEYQSVKKLIVHNLQSDDFVEIYAASYPKSLSETDKAVLHIANKINASVLSSDKTVRNFATKNGVSCHGMIWIFDRLVEQGILSKKVANIKLKGLIALNFIYQNNQSLVDEIQTRLKIWN